MTQIELQYLHRHGNKLAEMEKAIPDTCEKIFQLAHATVLTMNYIKP
ncbi:hypothetical protein CGMCC3_g9292 [Colletotrichum fructicola]|nr:uncharacterized protein CGMCC3_g9292 [Colletotrichum fructicola]KAE9574747.1 hypothetical protein CGMCC3_g9292 [Colletotrichum fructicola]